ncbi:MAG: thioredoxin-disulfide reductase [Spirochaetales bacterium]|jgi:thioredoxin reductase (NADPH)|nr:thioredoxin-disulfide reductase [Spirochaetales bacterium]
MSTDIPIKDVIVIGGGAAGLSAAQYCARAGLAVLVVEEMALGGQALVIEGVENYPGFPDPVSGFEFAEKFEKQAKKFGAEFLYASVQSLKKEGRFFTLTTSKGVFTSYAVILATGAKHRLLDIPGEKELAGRGVSYCATCDGPFFKNQKILVVGGGDAACDEAMFLAKLTDKVVMIHRRERFRAQKALAERVLKNKNIEVRFNTVLEEIKGKANDKGIEKTASGIFRRTDTGERYEEEINAVFIFAGTIPETALVPQLDKDEGGYIVTDERMETSLAGLFCAGDVRATQFRQLIVAAGEGAVAAHSAAQYIDDLGNE